MYVVGVIREADITMQLNAYGVHHNITVFNELLVEMRLFFAQAEKHKP